jgi:Uma2 family endonuclease
MGEPARRTSYDEYLALFEDDARFEYHDGVAVAMVPPSADHARLAGRLIELLRARLDGACTALPAGLRVRVEATNRTLLPDMTVVCGALERSKIDPQGITNPRAIVEVLSPSTADYDLGPKFHHYRRIAILEEYVTVAQDRRFVSIARRVGDLWSFEDVGSGGTLKLHGIELRVDELYRDALGVIVD